MHLLPTEVMVSFDIKSKFTNVPEQEALEVIHGKLVADESLRVRTALMADQVTHFFDLCMRTTYFLFQGMCYQLKDGTTTESPVIPCSGQHLHIYLRVETLTSVSEASCGHG